MRKDQFEAITKWQKETFPNSYPVAKLAHLSRELDELYHAIVNKDPDKRLEYADCFFLLFGAAREDGMSYEDICKAIDEKLEINKKRKWGKPDSSGVVSHLKE